MGGGGGITGAGTGGGGAGGGVSTSAHFSSILLQSRFTSPQNSWALVLTSTTRGLGVH